MKIASSTLKRVAVPALVAGLTVPVFATPAAAQTPGSTAFRIFGMVVLSANAGAQNTVVAGVSGSFLRLTDASGVAAGPGCFQRTPTTVDCPLPVSRLAIGLGDGNDSFTGTSLAVRTTVDAGPGVDNVMTGSGSDTIGVSGDAVGNGPDTVSCGGGADVVFRDPADNIAANCETRF